MDRAKDLADPAFEPTDDELVDLGRRACAGVREAMAKQHRILLEEIAAERNAVMTRLREAG